MKIYLTTLFLIVLSISCSNQKSKHSIDLSNHKLDDFVLEKYLGEWEEIARTDNKFETDLTHVTANYFMKNNKFRIINRGWNPKKQIWKEARGYIKFTDNPSKLKVSFFRPFYGNYNILYVDNDYQYAVVGGSTSDYFWILKRKDKNIKISKEQIQSFLKIGSNYGYNTDNLIYNFLK